MTAEFFIRISIFTAVLVLFASLEALFPRRKPLWSRIRRWPGNLGVSVISQIFAKLLVPVSGVVLAQRLADSGKGLFNVLDLPLWLEFIAAVLVLDLLIYVQHRVFHRVPLFWRLHRMHHADTDFDVTTAIRFHPLEIWLSALIKLAAVFLLGPSALAVLVFEVILNATAMFNHSNLKLPAAADRLLRLLVVTPDMHRVHHSIIPRETHSNFGFNFPWWDRLFGTYREQPEAGHSKMTIGLPILRSVDELRLYRLLMQPFRQSPD